MQLFELDALSPDAGDAVRIIAHIGGFRPCPSVPRAGVKSLWLGLRCLDGMEVGWQLAMATLAAKDTGLLCGERSKTRC